MHEIFEAEIEAGFTQDLLFRGVSIASRVSLADTHIEIPKGLIDKVAKATNRNQIDLAYLETVLVTTGWNKNDDHFDPLETWAARHSPEDKPFNYEHDQSDIIGHITGCYVVDDDFKVIADDTSIDDLPEKFHIITGSVLYKKWDDEDRQKRMDTILAEIAKGEWYVSMECLFRNYDYLLIDEKSKAMVVKERTKETAFLTKHLRTYGGSGEFQGYKVKRMLKNIVFSGKGLVRNPANPESVIINDAFASVTNSNKELILTMANEAAETLSELKSELTLAKRELAEERTKAAAAAKAAVEAEISTLKADISARDKLVAELKTKIEATEKSLAEKTRAADEAEKAKKEYEDELKKTKRSQAKQDKVSRLVAAGLSHEDASTKAEKFLDVPDEAFAEYVDVLKAAKEDKEKKDADEKAKKEKEAKAASDKTDEEEVDDEDLDEEEDEAEAKKKAEAAKKALETAVPDADVAFGYGSVEMSNERRKTVAALSKNIRETILSKKNKK